MQYFSWMTDYMLYQRAYPKEQRKPYDEFLRWRLNTLRSYGMPPVRHDADAQWALDGYPYYNIHPKLTSKLCKMDLTKIPSTLLKMPHGLNTVNIRFAQQHQEFTVFEEQVQTSNLPFGANIPAGSFVRSLMMRAAEGIYYFLLDFGVMTPHGQPTYWIFGMRLWEEHSMLEAIKLASRHSDTDADFDSCSLVVQNVLRLAVTIGFLADNPTICEADVLADDRHKYHHGTEDEREFIAARAKRRGKFGFNIGTDLMFLGERPQGERRTHAATGRELEYAHIRAGHPHGVRYGEGKRLVKIMWYVPTTVRDDLPFKG